MSVFAGKYVAWALVATTLLSAADANAEVRAGAAAGATLTSAFPAWFAGGDVSVETSVVDHVSIIAEARIQLYAHPEEEDFGSWGFQEDLGGGVRVHVFRAESQQLNPFAVGRARLAVVQRIPFAETDDSDLIVGYIVGGAVGVDWPSSSVVSRVELAFDMPSFTTHDDSSDPAPELSLVVSAKLPW
ncbi:MAG TPA: hypothetical protein VIV40_15145 [Kofleriaceae bacterium]